MKKEDDKISECGGQQHPVLRGYLVGYRLKWTDDNEKAIGDLGAISILTCTGVGVKVK